MLTALYNEAVRRGDRDLVQVLAPGTSPHAARESVQIEEHGVPAALLGLVAQRGQLDLLERLLRFSKLTETPQVASAAALPKPDKLKTKDEKIKVVQTCLDGVLERALSEGDGEAVACLLPEYDAAVTRGHLQPIIPRALVAFAALASRRGDSASLKALGKAGAIEYAQSIAELDVTVARRRAPATPSPPVRARATPHAVSGAGHRSHADLEPPAVVGAEAAGAHVKPMP